MSVSVCLSDCLFAHISQKPHAVELDCFHIIVVAAAAAVSVSDA